MEATNLADLYELPLMDWTPVEAQLGPALTQAPGTGGPNRHTCWLTTVNADGSPHVTAVGALWEAGAFWVCASGASRKARNLAPDAMEPTGGRIERIRIQGLWKVAKSRWGPDKW